jgi:hypothetical protein
LLLTAILTSFEYKQTLVGFLDISGAYDNVLIDIIYDQMHQAQLPARIESNVESSVAQGNGVLV